MLRIAAIVLVLLILLGFSGKYIALGDSIAVIRPLIGLLALILALVFWRMGAPAVALVTLMSAVLALGSIAPGLFATQIECTGQCLTLYQKNLLSKAWPRYELANDIVGSGAEIVTLQEDSAHNRRFMAAMFDHYPDGISCDFRPNQRVTVLSRLPVVPGSAFCLPAAGVAGIQVQPAKGPPIWALSLHLEWPYPYDQRRQSRVIAAHIAQLEGPVLIAGDFNMVPWGGSVALIGKAAGNLRLGRLGNTFRDGNALVPLPIDMVWVPKGAHGSIELRPYMGSDHRGVLARIALPE